MTELEKFEKTFPVYAGIIDMHNAGMVSWTNAVVPLNMFDVWQECSKLKEHEFCNALVEISNSEWCDKHHRIKIMELLDKRR